MGWWSFPRLPPLIFLVAGILAFLIDPVFFDWSIHRKVSAAYRDENKRTTLSTGALRIIDGGLQEISGLGETKIKWDVISSITEALTYAIISIQSAPSMIIPENRVSRDDYKTLSWSVPSAL